MNFQITVAGIAPIVTALEQNGHALYEAAQDRWYRVGADEFGQREFLVQDPNGYLVRFVQDLGRRPVR